MPSSYHEQIPIIIDILLRIKPDSLLDVGIGFGKYGFLAREYLEIWNKDEEYGRFKVRIDGVEPFKRYITPCHEYIYDNIYNMAETSSFQHQRFFTSRRKFLAIPMKFTGLCGRRRNF